jgi:3-phenylpropionate/trans-cinnamate dioxygenase ferredoxin reductase subunit
MSTDNGYVIVGASLAGANAAQALRAEGYAGPLTLIGAEQDRPYERPPLSKDFLMGKTGRDKLFVHPAEWYGEHDVELRLGTTVTALDPGAHQISLAGGERIGYQRLLLATGAAPRRVEVPGADLDGVHYLRTVGDSERIRAAFAQAGRVVVIGAGWIGLEAAAAAREAGRAVTVLETAELPLLRVLGREVAEVFADLHAEHGVDLRFGVQVAEITGAGGSAAGVRLADGTLVPADVVVVGIGAGPNTGLAEAAGIATDNGVVTDAGLRTSAPDVFAAGDVASAFHPRFGRHVRVEHWDNAINQAKAAGLAMTGQEVSYDRLPYFFTDQYDLGMEYVGHVAPGGYQRVVFRGDVPGREFIAFWLDEDGRVLAGMNVNIWDVNEAIGELIRAGRPVSAEALADPAAALESLAGG